MRCGLTPAHTVYRSSLPMGTGRGVQWRKWRKWRLNTAPMRARAARHVAWTPSALGPARRARPRRRTAHAPRAKIAEAEDAAAIRKDDAIARVCAVGLAREMGACVLAQHVDKVPALRDRHVAAARRHRDQPKLLACLANGRRVHDGQQLVRRGEDGGVVELRVLFVETAHVRIRVDQVSERRERAHLLERLVNAARGYRPAEHLGGRAQAVLRVPALDAARRGDACGQ